MKTHKLYIPVHPFIEDHHRAMDKPTPKSWPGSYRVPSALVKTSLREQLRQIRHIYDEFQVAIYGEAGRICAS